MKSYFTRLSMVTIIILGMNLSACGGGGGSSTSNSDIPGSPDASVTSQNVAGGVQKSIVSKLKSVNQAGQSGGSALVRKLSFSDTIQCTDGGSASIDFDIPDEVLYDDQDGQATTVIAFENCVETYSDEESCFQTESLNGSYTCIDTYEGNVVTQNCFTGNQGDPCSGETVTYILDGTTYEIGLELSVTFDLNDPSFFENDFVVNGSVCINGEEIGFDEIEEEDLVCEQSSADDSSSSDSDDSDSDDSNSDSDSDDSDSDDSSSDSDDADADEITLGINNFGDGIVVSGLPGCNTPSDFATLGAVSFTVTQECNDSGIVNELVFTDIRYNINDDIDSFAVTINGVAYDYER